MKTFQQIKTLVVRKRKSIVYWIATLWLALGMISTGIVQLLNDQATVDIMTQMGYPIYFLSILGVGKVMGVIAILIPKFPLLKEWAYAGFVYIILGAAYTYIAVNNFDDLYHLVLLLVLVGLSWYLRPASRKLGKE